MEELQQFSIDVSFTTRPTQNIRLKKTAGENVTYFNVNVEVNTLVTVRSLKGKCITLTLQHFLKKKGNREEWGQRSLSMCPNRDSSES